MAISKPIGAGKYTTGLDLNVFEEPVTKTVASSASFSLPSGTLLVSPGGTGKIQLNTSTTSTANWVDITAAGNGTLIQSDGQSARVLNTSGSATTTVTYVKLK